MGSNLNQYLSKKKRVFDPLEELDRSSDDEDDVGRKASEHALSRAMQRRQEGMPDCRMKQRPAPSLSDAFPPLEERPLPDCGASSSDPSDGMEQARIPPSSMELENEKGLVKPPVTLRKTVSDTTTKNASGKSLAQTTGKRKREPAAKLVPEALRVFDGCHLYFFPNNDAAPARKRRIMKACEYGAIWHKQWDAQVTHVVMDKSVTFDHLLAWLKFEGLPDNVVMVNEVYPAECIIYGVLLDPSVPRFAVKGSIPSRVDSANSDTSLKPGSKDRTGEYTTNVPASARTANNKVAVENSSTIPRIGQSLPASEIASSKELDEAIAKAKTLQNIDISEDEEDVLEGNHSSDQSGDEEEENAGMKRAAKRKGKFPNAQDKWQCMQKNTGDHTGQNPNTDTIEILQQMAEHYGQTGDEWRVRAYRKAIATLRRHTVKINTKAEAGALPNIGPRLAEKIEEIVFTRRLRRLDHARAEPHDQILQTFLGVYGAGIKQATEWVNAGYRTLGELLEKAPSLTPNQMIGIAHYEDFATRISRSEVEKHGSFVRTALHRLDPRCEVIIGGSYRRGAKDSGDIDCIITRPDTGAAHLRNIVLGQLVPQLTESGFLVANLAMSSGDDGSKWHGASCLPGSKIWRRLDLLLVPSDEMGAALIYFTGKCKLMSSQG